MKKNKFVAGIIISLLVSSITALWTPTASATEQKRIILPFWTSWEIPLGEEKEPSGRVNSVYAKNDFYGYPAPNNPPPELGPRNSGDMGVPTAPNNKFYDFGSSYLMAAGYFGSTNSYCYFNLFDMTTDSDYAPPIKIRPYTFIHIFYRHHNLSHCMIDAQLYNKDTQQYWTLRDFNYNGKYIVDQNGVRIHPGYRYNDPVGSWQNATFDLSIIYESNPNWYITRIWIGFDNRIDPNHPTGPARTYFDMLHITYAVGDKKTVTIDTPSGYYNVWLSAAIEAQAQKILPWGRTLWLKVAVSGFSDGYAKDEYGHPLYYRYPYKLRVLKTAGATALSYPPPTGVNLTKVDETVGPGKAEFLFNLALIFLALKYEPVGWALTAFDVVRAFAGLLFEEPSPEVTYEWPKAVNWEDPATPPSEKPPNLIQGEVYIEVSNLTEGWNSIPLTFEVDTYLADYYHGWRPGGLSTESFPLNINWTSTPDYVNLPPDPPSTPSGFTSGYVYMGYTYNTSTTDPDGDKVRYEFWWGDDTTKTGWYASGETATASHYWTSPGTYQVKVRAQDSGTYTWSDWSPSLTVTITILPQPPPVEENRYCVMEGITSSCGYLNGTLGWKWMWTCPFATRPPNLTPLLMSRNITFSDPDPVTGVVYLTVLAESYVGLDHISFDSSMQTYFRFQLLMEHDAFGWLFTGEGTDPIPADVDCYTFSNFSGVYWLSPSPFDGQLAALQGGFPSVGPDGIAGTNDDGFGDGTPDPPGASILYVPTKLKVNWWSFDFNKWNLLFESAWPLLLTTGTAYSIVNEPDSEINGASSMQQGQPWEFLAGQDTWLPDRPAEEKGPVPWNHSKCNAYVTYACVWSMLSINTGLGWLDMLYKVEERIVREDLVIADINGDEVVNIKDIVTCSIALGAQDEGFGYMIADANYDARADIMDPRGTINIKDIVRIAIDLGARLTPNGIIRQ